MKSSRIIMLTVTCGLLVLIAASSLLQPKRNEIVESNIQIQNVENDPLILDGSQETQSQMMEVNNIGLGSNIKNKLDKQDEVTHYHHNDHDTSHYYDHEVTVSFIKVPSAEELDQTTRDLKGWIIKQDGSTYLFRSTNLETPEMLEYFRGKPNVAFAEPQYILMQNDVSMPNRNNRPNDQLYQERYQWNLPAIGTEQGWSISRGNEDITIAVIDTGVDLDHPDLINRIVGGYNVIADDHFPEDDNGHGTHVAGIIASETNNGQGTAGVTWYNKIMPVKAMGAKGYGTTFDIAKGIIWAVDNGADVINLSLGNYQESNLLRRAINYAYEKDVVLVAAAGNDGSSQPSYPASYPEVLSVSAVNYDGNIAEFSNYGEYINITAPGVYIPSTYFNKQYASLSGTSMAAPHVAGLAGLVKSINPDLTNKEIMSIIQNSAIDIGQGGRDIEFGNGLIDVNQALKDAELGKPIEDKVRERLNFNRK